MNTLEARQPRRLAFLFGSGVSLTDGFPRTDEITEAVERHLRAEHMDDEAILLESLRWHLTREDGLQESQRTNPEARQANYEDIYYLASQLSDLASGEYDNPAVYPLMDRLLVDSRMGPIAFRDTLRAPTSERPLLAASRLGNISASLTRAIKTTVTMELTAPFRRGSVTYAGYGAVLDALQDPAVDAIEVFTLNHDCLLEATLDHHGVDYTVVVPGDGNHSYGRGGAEPSPDARLRIVKVHGSVSWGIKHEPGEQLWDRLRRLGFEAVGTAGKGEPVILVGRFNKMTDQANQVLFLDLLYAFRERLAGVRHLVVSGYGFSDKNVNTLLLEWLSWEDERKAVVVHENRKALLGSARPAIAGRPDLDSSWIGGLERAERRGKLGFYPHWFQDTSWAELKDVLKIG